MSKIALVTTTINVPRLLKLIDFDFSIDLDETHRIWPEIFIAGDLKTPGQECLDLAKNLSNRAHYLSPDTQKSLGYACSELVGWNCIQRRNIATLEALKWGADIIVMWDDDNIPLDRTYLATFERALTTSFNGVEVRGNDSWFDVGQLLVPTSPHRGFPTNRDSAWSAGGTTNTRVGVAAGICMGDPDVDAMTRLVNRHRPLEVHQVSQLLDAGVVVSPETWTVFNSQNTAFIRELAPAAFLMPGVGRYDDIFMSLIMQRVMQITGHQVHFGRPYIWQARNPHDLLRDFRAEVEGVCNTANFGKVLDRDIRAGRPELTVSDMAHEIIRHVGRFFSEIRIGSRPTEAYEAWLEDVAKVMA